MVPPEPTDVHRSQLVNGLAGAFGLMTAILVVGGVVGSPVLLFVALLFGAMTYILWAHATGRLMSRVYRGVEDHARTETGAGSGSTGGFGAGPRAEWTGPRQGRTVSEEARRRAREQARRRAGAGTAGTGGRQAQRAREGPTAREAYDRLGVEPGADEATVKRAYRERIKEVHPDADGGDAEEFKRVQQAYDRLTE